MWSKQRDSAGNFNGSLRGQVLSTSIKQLGRLIDCTEVFCLQLDINYVIFRDAYPSRDLSASSDEIKSNTDKPINTKRASQKKTVMGKMCNADIENKVNIGPLLKIMSLTFKLLECPNNSTNLRAKCGLLVEIATPKRAVFSGGDDAVALDADAARSTGDRTRHVPVFLVL